MSDIYKELSKNLSETVLSIYKNGGSGELRSSFAKVGPLDKILESLAEKENELMQLESTTENKAISSELIEVQKLSSALGNLKQGLSSLNGKFALRELVDNFSSTTQKGEVVYQPWFITLLKLITEWFQSRDPIELENKKLNLHEIANRFSDSIKSAKEKTQSSDLDIKQEKSNIIEIGKQQPELSSNLIENKKEDKAPTLEEHLTSGDKDVNSFFEATPTQEGSIKKEILNTETSIYEADKSTANSASIKTDKVEIIQEALDESKADIASSQIVEKDDLTKTSDEKEGDKTTAAQDSTVSNTKDVNSFFEATPTQEGSIKKEIPNTETSIDEADKSAANSASIKTDKLEIIQEASDTSKSDIASSQIVKKEKEIVRPNIESIFGSKPPSMSGLNKVSGLSKPSSPSLLDQIRAKPKLNKSLDYGEFKYLKEMPEFSLEQLDDFVKQDKETQLNILYSSLINDDKDLFTKLSRHKIPVKTSSIEDEWDDDIETPIFSYDEIQRVEIAASKINFKDSTITAPEKKIEANSTKDSVSISNIVATNAAIKDKDKELIETIHNPDRKALLYSTLGAGLESKILSKANYDVDGFMYLGGNKAPYDKEPSGMLEQALANRRKVLADDYYKNLLEGKKEQEKLNILYSAVIDGNKEMINGVIEAAIEAADGFIKKDNLQKIYDAAMKINDPIKKPIINESCEVFLQDNDLKPMKVEEKIAFFRN
jgi:hypothetical protein